MAGSLSSGCFPSSCGGLRDVTGSPPLYRCGAKAGSVLGGTSCSCLGWQPQVRRRYRRDIGSLASSSALMCGGRRNEQCGIGSSCPHRTPAENDRDLSPLSSQWLGDGAVGMKQRVWGTSGLPCPPSERRNRYCDVLKRHPNPLASQPASPLTGRSVRLTNPSESQSHQCSASYRGSRNADSRPRDERRN